MYSKKNRSKKTRKKSIPYYSLPHKKHFDKDSDQKTSFKFKCISDVVNGVSKMIFLKILTHIDFN